MKISDVKEFVLEVHDEGGLGDYTYNKIQNYTNKYVGLANNQVDNAEELATNALNNIQLMANSVLTELLSSGVDTVYQTLGINEESIQVAQKLTNIASNGMSKIMSFISFMPSDLSAIPGEKGAISALSMSLSSIVLEQYQSLRAVYNETIAGLITCGGNILEVLKETADLLIEEIIKVIDPYVYLYTGYHVIEVIALTREGIQLINLWKKAKKNKRKKKNDNNDNAESEDDNTGDSSLVGDNSSSETDKDKIADIPPVSGGKSKKSIKIHVDSDTLKELLIDWLRSQSAALYNAFLLLNIKDIILDILETIQKLTNLSIDTIAESINTLDDFIELFDSLGLGDDTPGLTLEDIKNMGLSFADLAKNILNTAPDKLYSGMVEQANVLTSTESLASLGSAVIASSSTEISTTQEYEINSMNQDGYTQVDIIIYTKVTASIKKSIKNNIASIKSGKKKVFNSSGIQSILTRIDDLYEENTSDLLVQLVGKINNAEHLYKFVIICKKTKALVEKEEENEKNKPEKISTSGIDSRTLKDIEYLKNKIIADVTLDIVQTGEETTLLTFLIVKTLFKQLKPLLTLLTTMAKLIQNYKINKAKTHTKAITEIYAGLMDLMRRTGLINSKSISDKNIYTVRSKALYDYCINTFNVVIDKDGWSEISAKQTITLKNYIELAQSNTSYSSNNLALNTKYDTLLYFDTSSINTNTIQVDNKIDGTTNGLDNLCIIPDTVVMYSENQRSTMTSQIMRAIQNKVDPYEK